MQPGATHQLGLIAERATDTHPIESDGLRPERHRERGGRLPWACDRRCRRPDSVDRSKQDPGAVDERPDCSRTHPSHDGARSISNGSSNRQWASTSRRSARRRWSAPCRSASANAAWTTPARTWNAFARSKDELQALIETIVIPETWFFRDREAFAALVRFVHEEWLPTHADGCLRLLSLPCSTGEEPYSMAMALLDAHVPPTRFRIDAIDICGRSLAHARRGIYGKGSFRGDVAAYRERYFEPVPGGTLCASSTAAGEFSAGQFVERRVSARCGYLRRRVLPQSADLFRPGDAGPGRVGPRSTADAERNTVRGVVGERRVSQSCVLFGEAADGVCLSQGTCGRDAEAARGRHEDSATSLLGGPIAIAGSYLPPAEIRLPPPPESGAEEAVRLADQGHFAEASRCCEAQLLRQGPSAQVFHVLGLVRDASGNADDAAIYYRKALYLDPGHQDALVHLALLMEKQGLKSEAQTLWNRARRLAVPRAQ